MLLLWKTNWTPSSDILHERASTGSASGFDEARLQASVLVALRLQAEFNSAPSSKQVVKVKQYQVPAVLDPRQQRAGVTP